MGFFLYNGLCPEKVAEKGRIPVLDGNGSSSEDRLPTLEKGAIAKVQSKRGKHGKGLRVDLNFRASRWRWPASSEASNANLVDGPTSLWLQKGM
jgi:hypothetical protein